MELLAQAVEALSVLTTKKYATKEPRKIDRPDWVGGSRTSPGAEPSGGNNPFARAIDRILAVAPPKRGAAA
jgi:hypothetical protein